MSKKLAIAMFGQKRLSREGGVEIVVKELCTRMAQNGCDVTCYNRAGHHVSGAEYDDAGKTEYEGIRQKSVPTIERRGLAAVSSSAFAALYSAFGKYDVVHIHAEGPAFFAWLPKMFGKRVVVTVHGIDWQREKWQAGLGSKFIHQGEKNAAKYADEVIVLSKGVQDYFKETYGRETHFIPNGVNRPQIREASLITDKFGLKKDSYILFLGRLVPEKGIRYLVEAFKNVKTDKKLVIAGGSSDTDSFMEELKDLAKGDDRILFTGFVQGAMLDELYSKKFLPQKSTAVVNTLSKSKMAQRFQAFLFLSKLPTRYPFPRMSFCSTVLNIHLPLQTLKFIACCWTVMKLNRLSLSAWQRS